MSLIINRSSLDNCNVIGIEGAALSEVDFEELNDLVTELCDTGQPNVILDLAGVKVLNSLGINTLIRLFTRCRNHGGDLYIVNISDKINQVLLLTKLNTVLNIAPSVDSAVASINS